MPQPIVMVGLLPPQAWEHARLPAIILTMRRYAPKPQALNGRWRPSAVERMQGWR